MQKTALLIMVICAIFLMTMYDFYGAFLLGIIMLLTPVPGLILLFCVKKDITVTTDAPTKAFRNQEIRIPFHIHSRFFYFLPFTITIKNKGDTFSYNQSEQALTWTPTNSGRIIPPAVTISFTDPFHLFYRSYTHEFSPMVIMPKKIGYTRNILHALLQGIIENKEYFGATAYEPGDNIKLMNWKVTARKDDLYMRDTQTDTSPLLTLAADYDTPDSNQDILFDTLFSSGMALLDQHHAFRFLWCTEKNSPHAVLIRTQEEWFKELYEFLLYGGTHALSYAPCPSDSPVIYFTNQKAPYLPSSLFIRLWTTNKTGSGELCGTSAILEAIGGQ